jgi:predicted AlkP superfamily pyrophosphatase or phosphodiesterase
MKPRSAIMLAGQPSPSTYAVWFEDRGPFATSTAYARAPWPVVDQFIGANPIDADYGHVWTRARPAAEYLFGDWAAGELAPVEFPHPLVSKSGTPDGEFVTLWKRSPLSDRYLGRMGQHLTEALKLGQAPGTDLLGIGFSALDTVGHEYGPHSHEVQDVLMRLDETIGELLDTLDTLVGRERYVVALTADHGVALIPEQDQDVVAGAGRYASTPLRTAINTTIESLLGPGTHVASKVGSHIYLAPGVLNRVLSTEGGREAVTRAAVSVPGVARVFWADELASTVPTDDAHLRASRLSYVEGLAGDLMLVTEAHWVPQAAGTTHGSPHGYDQHVPLVLAGAGIKPGRYLSPATPADIAPTLALLVGMTMAQADGRPLTDAIR